MKRLVIANWKMNPASTPLAKKLFGSISKGAAKYRKVETVIAPPFVYLPALAKSKLVLGAQDAFWKEGGAYTGEIGIGMLKEFGVKYVILGHSERRALGESSQEVNLKIKSALKEKVTPVVCIGEAERDHHGKYLSFLRDEIKETFKGISKQDISKVVIAYEPIWAIGRSAKDAVTSRVLHETVLYIKKILVEMYGRNISKFPSVIYGGSAEVSNVEALMGSGEIVGFLVGHASLSAENFLPILEIVNNS